MCIKKCSGLFATFNVMFVRTHWIQQSGERRVCKKEQFIIKVSSLWFYNQQEEVLNQKSLTVIDRFVFNNLAVDNAGNKIASIQAA